MAFPRFKLDLVTYDDPAALLPLPLAVEPSRATLLHSDSAALDEQLARNEKLVEQLNAVLTATDISFVQPVNSNVASAFNPPSLLAARLVAHNPILFQYGVSEVDTGAPLVATPGPSGTMAVAAHNSQPDAQTNPSVRRERPAPDTGTGARKRARRAAKPDVYVLYGHEAEAAAAKLTSFLESSVAAAAKAAEDTGSGSEGEEDDDDEDAEDGEGGARGRGRGRKPSKHRFRLGDLRSLHQELLKAQSQGYLRLVPGDQLHALLLALHDMAGLGGNKLLHEDAELKSQPVARVAASLEAVLCELVVLSTPRLPPSLYLEEVLGRALELARYHLLHNVLALHDPRFKRQYRPGSGEEEDEHVKVAKRGRHARSTAAHQLPSWCGLVGGQLEQVLGLLCEVVAQVRVAAEGLISLVRHCQQLLTVDALQNLHYRAIGLTVSLFKYYPLQRSTVVDELVQGALAHGTPGKHVPRHYPLQSLDPSARIQMCAALVLQLVQVAAELPQLDAGAAAALSCTELPTRWADYFWHGILTKLPASRASKAAHDASTQQDVKTWVEALVEDLLSALPHPEWPAAGVLLRRLIMAVLKGDMGLGGADSGVRMLCVDVVGLVSRRLCALAREAEAQEAASGVAALVQAALASGGNEADAAAADKSEVVQQLLLEHLAAWAAAGGGGGSGGEGGAAALTSSASAASTAAAAEGGGGGCGGCGAGGCGAASIAGSARQLIACSMLSAHVKAVKDQSRAKELDEARVGQDVAHYRQIYERKRSCFGTSTSGLPPVSRDAAFSLCRWLVADSVLGRSRPTLLKFLAEAGGGARQDAAAAAAVRAKAIKMLGGVIEADVRVLSVADVQEGIKGALGNDSVLVREAAVDLIGKHISRNSELAVQYYDILVRASEDAGVTVRKRGIRLLWECCVRCPDFTHRSDALLRIVQRATDPEDTMRALVTKICAEIWFLPKFQIEDESSHEVSHVSRGPQQRAAQLGELVLALYGRMGAAAAVPFHAAMPIVVTIRSIVGEEGKPEYDAVRSGAKEVADALLGRALELQGEQDQVPEPEAGPGQQAGRPADPGQELFQCLLALHVLCVADVRLLHRSGDQQRVVRCLAPYIKSMPPAASDPGSRRRAEQLVVVLALLGGCMGALRHLGAQLADELGADLRAIIMKGALVQAVSVACQCLCTLAALKPEHRSTVREQAAIYYCYLGREYDKKVKAAAAGEQLSGSSEQRQRQFPRVLYALAMLCRYGADILDEAPEGSKHPTCAAALDLVLRIFAAMEDVRGVRESALQALGYILIARPHLAVELPGVRQLLEAALSRAAPAPLKSRCLAALTELLRVEEEALVGRQAAARQEAAAAQQASTLPEAEGRELARRNGEGDTGSVSSGIVQALWERILDLATDTSPAAQPTSSGNGSQTPPPTPSGTASAHGAVVRRRALDLIELAVRGGIVVPWTAMPALCGLATDPESDTAARALRCLCGLVTQNTHYVAGQVPAGVERAYAFHRNLAAANRPGKPPELEQCRPLVEGLFAVWSAAFQPDRLLRAKFVTALLKPLDEGGCLASGAAARSDPHLLSFVSYLIAELPYRKMDELLAVLARINEILSRRAEAVLGRFQELRQELQPQPRDVGAQPKPSASAAPPASPLPGRAPSAAAATAAAPSAAGLVATVKGSIAVCLMLLLKQYLRASYDLTTDRIAKYDPHGPQRKVEEKLGAVRSGRLRFNTSLLRVDVAARLGAMHPLSAAAQAGGLSAPGSSRSARTATAATAPSAPLQATASSCAAAGGAEGAAASGVGGVLGGGVPAAAAAAALLAEPGVEEVYRLLKKLMKQDELDYRHAVSAAAGGAEGEAAGPHSPADEAGEAIDVADVMAAPGAGAGAGAGSKKPPLASRGKGRAAAGGRGARAGRGTGAAAAGGGGRGRGRAAPANSGDARSGAGAKRGRKRKAWDGDDEEEEEDSGGDSDGGAEYKPKPTRRRLDKTL